MGVLVGPFACSFELTCGRTLPAAAAGRLDGEGVGSGVGATVGLKVIGFPFSSRFELEVLVGDTSELSPVLSA